MMVRTRLFRPISFAALTLLALLIPGCGGSGDSGGGGGSTGTTTPSVSLTAQPSTVASGASTTLTWTSKNVSSVVSSNFGATSVSGQKVVGPLSSTTTYTLTCTGPDGNASASAKVTVTSGVSQIPSAVLLYSIQNADGTSTLKYLSVSGSAAVTVGTFAAGVRVLATNPTGTRLLLVAPLASDPTKKAAYLTDLDGVSNSVAMGTDTDTDATDGAITSAGNVLVAWANRPASCYSLAGVRQGVAPYNLRSSNSVTICADGPGTTAYYNNRVDTQLQGAGLPTFDHQVTLENGAAYNWVRVDPTNTLITYCVGTTISTANAGTGANPRVIASGSYPTFDNTASRVFYSKVGDGIYQHNFSTGSDSRLVSISSAWDGRIFWH